MKHTRQSVAYDKEISRRRKVKKALMEKCPVDGAGRKLCPKCGLLPDPVRGLQLVHKKSLAQGGRTSMANCVILCGKCHAKLHRVEDVPKPIPHDRPTGIEAMAGFHGTGIVYNFSKEVQVGTKKAKKMSTEMA